MKVFSKYFLFFLKFQWKLFWMNLAIFLYQSIQFFLHDIIYNMQMTLFKMSSVMLMIYQVANDKTHCK